MHDNSSKSKISKNEYCGTSWCIMIHQNPKLADIDCIHYTPLGSSGYYNAILDN